MPLNLDSLRALDMVDIYQIDAFRVDNRDQTITIEYRVGARQPDGSVEYVVGTKNFTVAVGPYAITRPNGLRTWYENLKVITYKIGQDAGVFPAGTVT